MSASRFLTSNCMPLSRANGFSIRGAVKIFVKTFEMPVKQRVAGTAAKIAVISVSRTALPARMISSQMGIPLDQMDCQSKRRDRSTLRLASKPTRLVRSFARRALRRSLIAPA